MVDQVVTEEPGSKEDKSYGDAFDDMWREGESPNLELEDKPKEPIIEEETTPKEDGAPAEEDKQPEVVKPEKVENTRPAVAARDPYSWIEGLPEEQREMAEQLKHTALSDRGRVSALTRKLSETETALANTRAKPAEQAQEESSTANAPELSENIKQLQEDYPELGKQLAGIWAEREAALKQEFTEQLKPIQEARTADAVASEQQRLEQEAAVIFKTDETGTYWKDVVQSEDFNTWLGMQPTFIQNTARTSENAQDGIDVLRMYEDDYQIALAAQEAPAGKEKPVEDTTSRGDQLKAERAQRQATTVSPASKHTGTDTDGVAGDYTSTFNAMWGGKKK